MKPYPSGSTYDFLELEAGQEKPGYRRFPLSIPGIAVYSKGECMNGPLVDLPINIPRRVAFFPCLYRMPRLYVKQLLFSEEA